MEILADARPQQNEGLEGVVYNISFYISDTMSLCVGLRYIGGNPDKPRNYRLDHANLWRDGIAEPATVSPIEARRIMKRNGLFLKDLPSYLV